MKNKLELKKIALLILFVLLLLILLSNYLKSSETSSESIPLPAEAEKKLPELSQKREEIKNKVQEGPEEITAETEAVKNPFKAEKDLKGPEKNQNLNKSIFLEGDLKLAPALTGNGLIIEEERDLKSADKSDQNEKEETELKKEAALKEKNKRMKSFKPPFELIGIIKNKNNSAVILLYQGRKIIKKEKEMIDIFLIEKIKNKSLIISYKKVKKEMQLWGVQNED